MFVIVTLAPTAIAPALKHRSTLALLSTRASRVPDRTRHSSVTLEGTALTASPPRVRMPWMRTVSWSRKVSRLAWMAEIASMAALSALMPRCGEPPAWAPRPVNWTNLTTWPLLVPPTASLKLSGLVWVSIAMSMSSNTPSLINSCLPPMNSSLPSSRRAMRRSTSMNSSAGTAMGMMRPDRLSMTPGAIRPVMAPSMFAIWQWWPQAWAAPVTSSWCGCSKTRSESSSPITPTDGPGPAFPSTTPFTPVIANPDWWGMPMASKRSWTRREVLCSVKPVSGFARMVLAVAIISSLRASIAAMAVFFISAIVGIGVPPRCCLRSKRQLSAQALLLGLVVDVRGSRHVADGDALGLKQRYLLV